MCLARRRGVVFDETFIHRAENTTDQASNHPVLRRRAADEVSVMTQKESLGQPPLVKASATQNVDGEHVGVLNKVFGWLYGSIWPDAASNSGTAKSIYALKITLTLAVWASLSHQLSVDRATRLR